MKQASKRKRRTTARPGDKVFILEDYRAGAMATGQVGAYEGDFPRTAIVCAGGRSADFDYDQFVSGRVKMVDGRQMCQVVPYWSARGEASPVPGGRVVTGEAEKLLMYWFWTDNPRIRLQDGSVIWGDECRWERAGEPGFRSVTEELAGRKGRPAAERLVEKRAG